MHKLEIIAKVDDKPIGLMTKREDGLELSEREIADSIIGILNSLLLINQKGREYYDEYEKKDFVGMYYPYDSREFIKKYFL